MKKLLNWLKLLWVEAKSRWKKESGPFWKKVLWIAGVLSAQGLVFSAIDVLAKVGQFMIVAGAVMAFVAKFGVDPDKYEQKDLTPDQK